MLTEFSGKNVKWKTGITSVMIKYASHYWITCKKKSSSVKKNYIS